MQARLNPACYCSEHLLTSSKNIIQWKPLNVIKDNVIIRFIWSNWTHNRHNVSIQLLIVIVRLMLSVFLGPKVIIISGFRCIILWRKIEFILTWISICKKSYKLNQRFEILKIYFSFLVFLLPSTDNNLYCLRYVRTYVWSFFFLANLIFGKLRCKIFLKPMQILPVFMFGLLLSNG